MVKIGLNYPKTGPYSVQGLDQLRSAELAADEINAAGGILGHQIEFVVRDSMSKKDVTTKNVTEMIDQEGVKMVFGGSASSVAIAAGKVAQRAVYHDDYSDPAGLRGFLTIELRTSPKPLFEYSKPVPIGSADGAAPTP